MKIPVTLFVIKIYARMKTIKIIAAGLFLLFLSGSSINRLDAAFDGAKDPKRMKVLFIGNSITYYNSMPVIFKSLAIAAGESISVESWTRGGVILGYFALNKNAAKIINKEKWDYVVLQDGDYHIIYPEDHVRLEAYVKTLRDLILANNPETKILFHMLHALKGGLTHDNVHYDYNAFMQKIIEGTTAFANKADLEIAPVGIAWNDMVVNQPQIELYAPDGMHPSYAASYLIACVYLSEIFQKSSVGNSYTGGLAETGARIIQTVASDTVLNCEIK